MNGALMAAVYLTQFKPNSSPQAANQALKLATQTLAQAQHCAVVWFADIVVRKLFRELGYSSIYQYAKIELGFSTSRTGDFLRLSKKLDELPLLKKELEQGNVGYTSAREIIKVASPNNEKQWLQEARSSTRDALAKKVKRARSEAQNQMHSNPNQGSLLGDSVPDLPAAVVRHRIGFEMSTEQMARYEALWEKLYKCGGVPVGSDKVETILAGLAALVDSTDKVSKEKTTAPVQIHVHQCPECEKATISTSRGEIHLAAKELERLECDAKIDQPGKPNKATITPSMKRKILSRDRHQCQAKGCSNTRFLEIHHIIPRRRGGPNTPDNLITLCGGCHQILHDQNPGRLTTYDPLPIPETHSTISANKQSEPQSQPQPGITKASLVGKGLKI